MTKTCQLSGLVRALGEINIVGGNKMKKNDVFKVIIIVLLSLNLIIGIKTLSVLDKNSSKNDNNLDEILEKINDLPTLEEIDKRIMHWGQHFGQHFSR